MEREALPETRLVGCRRLLCQGQQFLQALLLALALADNKLQSSTAYTSIYARYLQRTDWAVPNIMEAWGISSVSTQRLAAARHSTHACSPLSRIPVSLCCDLPVLSLQQRQAGGCWRAVRGLAYAHASSRDSY